MSLLALPSPAPAAGASPASLAVAAILSGAAFGAILTACVTAWIARSRSREEERHRQREVFARAFEAYSAYKEMPYAIRRRRHDQPAAERVRLSEALREIQTRLDYYEAWTALESPDVGDAYEKLLKKMRTVAGGQMHRAWRAPAIRRDHQMNVPRDQAGVDPFKDLETSYLKAVREHLDGR